MPNGQIESGSISSSEMPGPRKVSQPTVSYLNVFPDSSHSLDKMVLCEEKGGNSASGGSCEATCDEKQYSGRYLELTKFNFVDAKGKIRSAEGVHMVAKNNNSAANNGLKSPNKVLRNKLGNLTTIAVIKKQIMCDCIVLVKQYRAPLKAYTIEFPATVIHCEDLPEDLAAKEIEDDTGYSSSIVKYISPLTSLEPDISDGKQQFVSLVIDGDDPLQNTRCRNNNQNTGAHGDIVEILKVPIYGLLQRLDKFDQAGHVIDSRVVAFAVGLDKGQNLQKAQTVTESESPQ